MDNWGFVPKSDSRHKRRDHRAFIRRVRNISKPDQERRFYFSFRVVRFHRLRRDVITRFGKEIRRLFFIFCAGYPLAFRGDVVEPRVQNREALSLHQRRVPFRSAGRIAHVMSADPPVPRFFQLLRANEMFRVVRHMKLCEYLNPIRVFEDAIPFTTLQDRVATIHLQEHSTSRPLWNTGRVPVLGLSILKSA